MFVTRQNGYICSFAARRNIDACVKAFIRQVKMCLVHREGIAR